MMVETMMNGPVDIKGNTEGSFSSIARMINGISTDTVDIKGGSPEDSCCARVRQQDACNSKPCRRLNRFRMNLLGLAVFLLILWHKSSPPPPPPVVAPEEEPRLHYEWNGNRFVLTYAHIEEEVSLATPDTILAEGTELADEGSNGVLESVAAETPACDPANEMMEVFGSQFRCIDMLDWCSQLSEYGHLATSCSCACLGRARLPNPRATKDTRTFLGIF